MTGESLALTDTPQVLTLSTMNYLIPVISFPVALEEESDVISFLKRQPTEYWPQDSKKFYPRAHKMGSYAIFDNYYTFSKVAWVTAMLGK